MYQQILFLYLYSYSNNVDLHAKAIFIPKIFLEIFDYKENEFKLKKWSICVRMSIHNYFINNLINIASFFS